MKTVTQKEIVKISERGITKANLLKKIEDVYLKNYSEDVLFGSVFFKGVVCLPAENIND